MPAANAKAWIQQIKFYDRWLFLVTDDAGRNYRDCENDEECYRIIEEAFPVTMLVGNRKDGAIEIMQAAAKITDIFCTVSGDVHIIQRTFPKNVRRRHCG